MAERSRSGRHARRRRRHAPARLALGVLALSAGLGAAAVSASDGVGKAPARAMSSAPRVGVVPTPQPTGVARPAGRPLELVIPSLGVDAPVEDAEVSGGVLRPPDDPASVGWWAGGAGPGDRRGVVLLAGHSVRHGAGALDELAAVRPGAVVEVGVDEPHGTGRARYRVVSVVAYDRAEVARRAPALFDPDGAHALAIVTCTDFDGVGYRSNVVVRAVPVGAPGPPG